MASQSEGEGEESFVDAEADLAVAAVEKDEARVVAGAAWAGMPASAIGRRTASKESATADAEAPRARSRSRSRSHSRTSTRIPDSRSSSATSQNRYSTPLPTTEPVPIIPARFLEAGRPGSVQRSRDDSPRAGRPAPLPGQRSSTAGNGIDATPTRSVAQGAPHRGDNALALVQHPPASGVRSFSRLAARRSSLSALPPHTHKSTLEKLESTQTRDSMSHFRERKNEDLFMELANSGPEVARPPSRSERALSRLSHAGKRRSMPADNTLPSSVERRPKSSGQAFANRPTSRLDVMSTNLQRHVDRYRGTPSRTSHRPEDTASLSERSQPGRVQRRPSAAEQLPASPSLRQRIASPESLQYGRRRPSFGAAQLQPQKTRQSRIPGSFDQHSESPEESSEAKQSQDSTDVDSESADTVWDELDDLKSRIKKLELTGKLPSSSGAAMSSNEASERPRTATTAPTTIDSSPKPNKQEKKAGSVLTPAEISKDFTVGGPSVAHVHPLLHSALAKAKPLLNSNLYRTLEATASDALQLAALTGGAGPQGTAFSAASIINGATVSDRHVRRKADTMCRNLTDMCLALCEGKNDAGSVTASPVTFNTPVRDSPSLRYSRGSVGPNEAPSRATARPMSRLEARRTSILGVASSRSPRRESVEDVSASEQEDTPSHTLPPEPHRFNRSGSRLHVRQPHYDETSGDEDPTIRPVSRATTDNFRTKSGSARDYNSPGTQRSPSLRDALVARRANAAAHDDNQKLSRVASLTSEGGRRRFLDPSTPPVMEEESNEPQEYQTNSASKRRVTSYGFGIRRGTADLPNRATSLNQRRHVVVE